MNALHVVVGDVRAAASTHPFRAHFDCRTELALVRFSFHLPFICVNNNNTLGRHTNTPLPQAAPDAHSSLVISSSTAATPDVRNDDR